MSGGLCQAAWGVGTQDQVLPLPPSLPGVGLEAPWTLVSVDTLSSRVEQELRKGSI